MIIDKICLITMFKIISKLKDKFSFFVENKYIDIITIDKIFIIYIIILILLPMRYFNYIN